MADNTAEKRVYTVLTPGWVAGAHRTIGDEITLTEKAAQYDLLSEKLTLKDDAKPAPAKRREPPASVPKD